MIRYNVFHDIWPRESPQYGPIALGYGIYLDDGASDLSVHHNVVYRTAGYAIMLHNPSRNDLVYNNTVVGSGGGWGNVINSVPGHLGTGVDGTVVANNLAVMLDDRVRGGGWCISFDSASGVPPYHHNGYYNLLANDKLNNVGVEDTGVVGDPSFTNAAGNDFSLLAGSPMSDTGSVIPGITDGYAGAAPDIGAYERGGSVRPGPRDEWWQSTMHTIHLSKTALNFGAGTSATTSAQSVLITSTGSGDAQLDGDSVGGLDHGHAGERDGRRQGHDRSGSDGSRAGNIYRDGCFRRPERLELTAGRHGQPDGLCSAAPTAPFGDFATPIDGTINVTRGDPGHGLGP